jgi:hypothetical protein
MTAQSINHYLDDGFKKVCDVNTDSAGDWYYTNIDQSLMFDDYRSWIYFIVLDGIVYKIGECGTPLGIKPQYIHGNFPELQPRKSTKCRLGRYRSGDQTDQYIRESLSKPMKNAGQVTIWAKRCPVQVTTEVLCGNKIKLINTIHKDLEQQYLRYFKEQTGSLPALNKGHI